MRSAKLYALFLTLALIAGCGRGGDEAMDTANDFWTALQNRDIATARTYATPETASMIKENSDWEHKDVDVEFGEKTVEDGVTYVKTTLHTGEADAQMTIDMKTVLVKSDGAWKVDVNQTMMSMFGGAMAEMMQGMTDAMQEMGQTVADGMQKGFEEMSESIAEESQDSSSDSQHD
ncbi:MAG: hypothetical protein JSW67_09290 [Candidatus Latescibacterota bacterium]|nr:MAG: hypothetical protein JSW67_09290 [Candidatus Latescibacterota bacterium]